MLIAQHEHHVALSAGHNPARPGASTKYITEHSEAVKWVDEIKRFCETQIFVDIVPTGSLTSKVKWINQRNIDLAIEVHFNACGGCGASGCETLFAPGSFKGEVAAIVMQKYLAPAMLNRDRGAKEGWYKMDRPGVKDYPGDVEGDETVDYFLRATKPVALIVEPEFVDHHLVIFNRRSIACKAIADAVREILSSWPLEEPTHAET